MARGPARDTIPLSAPPKSEPPPLPAGAALKPLPSRVVPLPTAVITKSPPPPPRKVKNTVSNSNDEWEEF
jgi:hypothetical protein